MLSLGGDEERSASLEQSMTHYGLDPPDASAASNGPGNLGYSDESGSGADSEQEPERTQLMKRAKRKDHDPTLGDEYSRSSEDSDVDYDSKPPAKKVKNTKTAHRRALQARAPHYRQGNEPIGAPGTLLYLSEAAKGDDAALDNTTAASHINKWSAILKAGDRALERALHKERRRTQRSPIVFAMLAPGSSKIHLAHGFEEVTVDEDEHEADGKIGFFLGDRITTKVDGTIQLHDPPVYFADTFEALATQFQGKPATQAACKQASNTLIPGDSRAKVLEASKLFPLPITWWSYFLTKARTPSETYRWIEGITRTWTAAELKTAATTAREWIRVACTSSTQEAASSSVAIPIQVAPRDEQLLNWASQGLSTYLPRPKPPPAQRIQEPPPRRTTAPEEHRAEHSAIRQAMVLAQEVIRAQYDKTARDKPKRLPEKTLCNLLGLCGLAWEDRDLLPQIWLDLHQQPDKAAKVLVLKSFFQDLGQQVRAFRLFRNSKLFEDIMAHQFEPGACYDTCHHGISLLAVSMRTFEAQERERQDDEDFEQATHKTPEAVRKHNSKGPPPLPSSVGDLLQALWRLIILTKGLFTQQCSLANQLEDLYEALQDKEQRIMSDPTAHSTLIPQLVWAITTASRDFYSNISKRNDVDPPDDGTPPKLPIAGISIYTSMFTAGIPFQVANMPEQWKRKQPASESGSYQQQMGGRYNRGDTDRRRGNKNPFGPAENAEELVNPSPPKAFAASSEFQKLKKKKPWLTLTTLCRAAGLARGTGSLKRNGWPDNVCLNYICMGKCKRRNTCGFEHPTSVEEATAVAMYQQLEPGIKKLLESDTDQKGN
jgi:hypothetical protein